MHGYYDGASDREHAVNYLEELGIQKASSPEEAKAIMERDGIAYLPLEAFAPQAKTMIAWRARYGLRTPINTVVRALNPGGAKLGIRGSYHPGFQQLHAEVENVMGKTSHGVISFKGLSGESEYNPKVSQTVWLSHNEGVESHYWEEQLSETLPSTNRDRMGTPVEDNELMANTVVSTMAALLFTETNDRELANNKALSLWEAYCRDQ